MSPDEFEHQLRSQPLRPVPVDWRDTILETARTVSSARPPVTITGPAWWREWLWPCPQAWVGLAALWVILLGLQVSARSMSSTFARQSPSPEKQMALAAQRRELFSLLDVPAEPRPAPKRTVPGPRSERLSPSRV